MNITTTARHCELDPEIRLFAQERLERKRGPRARNAANGQAPVEPPASEDDVDWLDGAMAEE